MPKNSVFIRGVILMAFSTSVFAQPTSVVPLSADVIPATSGREPSTAAPEAVSSKTPVDSSETVPIFPGNSVTGGELEALQAKTLLLEAKVQAARLKKLLSEVARWSPADSAPSVSDPVAGVPVGMSGTPVQTPPVEARHSGRIAVLEVSGRGQNLQATLSFPDGRQGVVQVGSLLPGTSLTVKAITLSSVTLSDGQQLMF
ncbi:type IV pilus biogenesis protein PilP [Salmonella enterica subsp. enterica serovar Albany]|nr:type IV pilus biogenesis protein PilP [Salmonella enterica subsp. enterica serovar Albany]EIJ2670519.1 type IV pilus biogenesis protein PilP [Salmonella enterica]EJO7316916.1 type IV pilus biogenesis protein PilP [Salmonella enterica subsp. enterica]EIM4780677.1 type IV pilus biogenesis protein PilP [Salmonella enterica]EJI7871829.1 type IV pilus biogenesis protein PilP [Salmonella enterica]